MTSAVPSPETASAYSGGTRMGVVGSCSAMAPEVTAALSTKTGADLPKGSEACRVPVAGTLVSMKACSE